MVHTIQETYLLRDCFSSYVYLKDMYITLKGIGKILFVWMLRILLICKILKFLAVFTKKNWIWNWVISTSYIKTNSKKYWLLNISNFLFLVFFLELKTREGRIVQTVRLEHKGCSRTRTDSYRNTRPDF